MTDVVLDASAVLAVIFDEPGADQVEPYVANAAISAVNLAEVTTRLLALGMPVGTASTILDTLQLSVQAYDYDQAMITAQLRLVTRSAGLSLGDRACLALARAQQVPALTADRAWGGIAHQAEVDVILIR